MEKLINLIVNLFTECGYIDNFIDITKAKSFLSYELKHRQETHRVINKMPFGDIAYFNMSNVIERFTKNEILRPLLIQFCIEHVKPEGPYRNADVYDALKKFQEEKPSHDRISYDNDTSDNLGQIVTRVLEKEGNRPIEHDEEEETEPDKRKSVSTERTEDHRLISDYNSDIDEETELPNPKPMGTDLFVNARDKHENIYYLVDASIAADIEALFTDLPCPHTRFSHQADYIWYNEIKNLKDWDYQRHPATSDTLAPALEWVVGRYEKGGSKKWHFRILVEVKIAYPPNLQDIVKNHQGIVFVPLSKESETSLLSQNIKVFRDDPFFHRLEKNKNVTTIS